MAKHAAMSVQNAKSPRGGGNPRGLMGEGMGISVGRPARDRGGLGGLFRVLDHEMSDQPTLNLWRRKQAAEGPK
jgi:hypothetical protein